MIGYFVLSFHFENAHYININRTFKAKTENKTSLSRICIYLIRVPKQWLWIALCRRTRQVVAFYLGDRSELSCRSLWNLVPQNYRHSTIFSDFWAAYDKVIQTGKHTSVGKDTGQTNHVERWNNTLRQRIGRFVRKTLSFSKCEINHFWFTHWFIVAYKLPLVI